MMVRSLWSAATGMHAQQTNIDAVANDLANVNTSGYKKTHVTFADLFYQRIRAAGVQGMGGNELPSGLQVGNGVRVTGTTKLFTKGNPYSTDVGTNMMLRDPGGIARNFFEVDIGGGVLRYTRDGNFTKDPEGNLVLPNGYILNGVTVPEEAQDIWVNETGQIQYTDDTGATVTGDQIQIARFSNPNGLSPVGDNLYQETAASGDPVLGTPGDDGYATILGGWIEASNVTAIDEMVKLITGQRAYEFNSRSIQTSDEMLQTVNNLKR